MHTYVFKVLIKEERKNSGYHTITGAVSCHGYSDAASKIEYLFDNIVAFLYLKKVRKIEKESPIVLLSEDTCSELEEKQYEDFMVETDEYGNRK